MTRAQVVDKIMLARINRFGWNIQIVSVGNNSDLIEEMEYNLY